MSSANRSDNHDLSPFAEAAPARMTISLWMLTFSLVVFAGFSMVIMLAARVPLIANSVNDAFGLPHAAKTDKPDRTTHLIFLLFCYSSPLLLAMWIGLLRSVFLWLNISKTPQIENDEPSNPFA